MKLFYDLYTETGTIANFVAKKAKKVIETILNANPEKIVYVIPFIIQDVIFVKNKYGLNI